MSYEGYTQILCKNGHYLTVDAFDDPPAKCPVCQQHFTWWNMVNTTNGSFDVDALGFENLHARIDGYVELQEKQPAETHTCSCGNVHPVAPATYLQPTDAGHLGTPPGISDMYAVPEEKS